MTADEPQPDEFASAQSEPLLTDAPFEAYRSVLRLLVGLALLGGDDLIAQLRQWETTHPPRPVTMGGEPEGESVGALARRALIGMVFETADSARQTLAGAAGFSVSLTGALYSAFQPVANAFPFRPFTAPIRAATSWGVDRLLRYARRGGEEEQRSRAVAGEVTGVLIADVVNAVEDNPGVKALVDAQVGRLLPALVNDATIQALLVEQLGDWIGGLATRPESLDPLVQQVGDRYIAYLKEHPDDVQNLVQGQAVGMATEFRDSVRTATVTGDTLLETLARRALRRAPRQDLPPPPPEVQRYAVDGRRPEVLPQPREDAE